MWLEAATESHEVGGKIDTCEELDILEENGARVILQYLHNLVTGLTHPLLRLRSSKAQGHTFFENHVNSVIFVSIG